CKELDADGLKSKLMDLRENVGTIREYVLELREQKVALEERLKAVTESLALEPKLLRHKGVFWLEDDPDPWCPQCWEIDHIAVHLNRSHLMAGRLCSCKRCEYAVSLDHTSPPEEWPEAGDG
ncbi:MAG: hypothetical protein V3T05_13340, partial [Myxococcota bacterium]